MWGAIIQAIDHAMGRMHEGAGAGIKVANSQHGGGAPISNMDSGAGEAVKQDLRNQQETTSEQDEAAEKAKIGSNSTSTGTDAGGQAEGGAGALGSIGSIGAGAGAGSEGASTEGAAEAASSILSDETAKSAQNASSDSDSDTDKKADKLSKFAAVRQYGAGVGKGFANAGAIATGNKAAEWEDIDNSAAKKAAENTVKNWRKRDFNKQENASTAEEK